MSFINDRNTIIRRSNKDMFYFYLKDNCLCYNYYNNQICILYENKLINNVDSSFSKYHISLDEKDSIYCIYCDTNLHILRCKVNSYTFDEIECIDYDSNNFSLDFTYIKYIDDNAHIFYYAFNKNNTGICGLFHSYKNNNNWIENKIDLINYIVLDDFTVLWNESRPTIFYLNLVDGCEEVFCCRFDLEKLSWSKPLQITHSNINKLYLNIIMDNLNFYHICFCEQTQNGFQVKYINGYLDETKFENINSSYVSNSSTCMYPSLVKINDTLFVSWVDFNKLFTSNSKNNGLDWSEPIFDNYSVQDDFVRCIFYSNYKDDLEFNTSYVFSMFNEIGILGL